jgi:hypothetical protein
VDERLQRRELAFDDLDAVIRDVEALADTGYQQVGNWDLAQVCGHLADWMQYPMDGYPRVSLPIRAMLWAMRVTIGRRELRKILAAGSMSSGKPTLRSTVPPPGGDQAAAVERLRCLAARFKSHQGDFASSPLFGELDRETMMRLQLIHCAHHLSFLVKK